MPVEQTAVIELDPATGKPKAPASSERDPNVNAAERSLDNVIAENKRKAEEIAELRYQIAELSEAQTRLSELQEKGNLTMSEKDEQTALREQIEGLKRDKRATAWRAMGREDSAAEAESVVVAREKIMAERFLKKAAEKDKVPYEKFEKEIVVWMRKVDPEAKLPVHLRAEDAYEAYKDDLKLQEDRAEITRQKQQFREGAPQSGTAPKSRAEALEQAKTDPKAMERYLKSVQDEQAKRHQ